MGKRETEIKLGDTRKKRTRVLLGEVMGNFSYQPGRFPISTWELSKWFRRLVRDFSTP